MIEVRSLDALGIIAKDYGPLLIPVVLSKIRNEIKLLASRKFGSNILEIEGIIKVLGEEL